MAVVNAIRAGLPVDSVDKLLEFGVLLPSEVWDLVIPRRTLTHRRSTGGRLTLAEGERLVRVERIVRHALDTFGEAQRARRYLIRPLSRFSGMSCLQMLDTETGASLVDELLVRVDYGIYG